MSTRGPSTPTGGRPRMAEALASLKEGLHDTADPLYDSWKLRQVASERPVVLDVGKEARRAATASSEARPSEGVPRPPKPRPPAPLTEGSEAIEAIDIALEGTPPETTAASSTPGASAGDLVDGIPAEELLIEFDEEFQNAEETTIARRPSVQADTVRVRVIRYRPFPRWALVAAAALVVFAISLVALRASMEDEGARFTRPVLASEVPAAAPAPSSRIAAAANVTAAQPIVAPPVVAAPSFVAPPAGNDAPGAEVPIANPSLVAPSAGGARTTAPAPKAPPSAKRRAASQDFFRDPGF